MRKIYYCLLLIIFMPLLVFADDKVKGEYGTYENAQKLIKEAMKTFYIRGPFIQYNYAKIDYGFQLPENATSQNILYMVCAGFSYDLYTEALGVSNGEASDEMKFPIYNTQVTELARTYLDNNLDNTNELSSGKLLIYYKGPTDKLTEYSDEDNDDEDGILTTDSNDNIYFTYNDSTDDINKFAKSIKPGDIFGYTGHILVAYDVFQNENGDWDVLLLNSGQSPYIPSRIGSTSKLSYNRYKNSNGNNNIIDVEEEGTIKWTTLRKDTHFIKDGSLKCHKTDECQVVRPFYNKNGKAMFNFTINKKSYAKSMLRTEYPGLLIEKTVNQGTNNGVYVGDLLKYTIKITNKSNADYNPQTYNKPFTIEETINKYTEYVASDGTYSNGKIKWDFSTLSPGSTRELTYIVKVKDQTNNVDKVIQSSGSFYKTSDPSVVIQTGEIKNKILPKVTQYTSSYNSCYNSKKTSYNGLELIDEIYKCVFPNENLNLDSFDFDDFILRNLTIGTTKDARNKAYVNTNSPFYPMVLNNYWSGMALYKSGDYSTILPRVSNDYPRAKTIYADHFKDGDVLLYNIDYVNGPFASKGINYTTPNENIHTKENGLYAYIYLNGKFVGINGSGTTARNEFTYDYYNEKSLAINTHLYKGYTNSQLKLYSDEVQDKVLTFVNYQTLYDKDNYVVLRPEMSIKELNEITMNKTPTKLFYVQNSENLDLSGGSILANFNDGDQTIELGDTDYDITTSGFDNTRLGTNEVTVKYKGKETSFNVEIVSKQATKIEMESNPTKTSYIQNYETLDLTGGSIKVTYSDDSEDIIPLSNGGITISGFDNTNVGNNKITVKYNNLETNFNVEIVSKQATEIEMKSNPTKTSYIQNFETLDLTGGTIKITYNDNSTSTMNLSSDQIQTTGFDNSKLGTNTITVKYNNLETNFNVEIISKQITKIEMESNPIKTNYVQNLEQLDLTGGMIKIYYDDGSTSTVSLSNSNVHTTELNNKELGKKQIIVEYGGYSTSFNVDVISKQIQSITVKTNPTKMQFGVSQEELSLTGGVLQITYNDGTTSEMSLTNSDIIITGYDNSKLGKQLITIDYLGRKTTLEIEIVKSSNIENPNTGIYIPIVSIVGTLIVVGALFIMLKKQDRFAKLK